MDKTAIEISNKLISCFEKGGKLLVCGNGGSSCESDHLVAEMVCTFETKRKPLPAISLTNSAILTAWSNDNNFSEVFSRQIEALGNPGDVLICLTTSGKSKNIHSAIQKGMDKGMKVIVFPTRDKKTTAHCQEEHLVLIHKICRLVDKYYET